MQQPEKTSKWQQFLNGGGAFLLILFGGMGVCVLFSLICSCKQIEYVTVPEVHEIHHHHTDSVKQTDSVKIEKETLIREARPEDSAMLAQMGIKLAQNERLLIMLQRELQQAKSELIEHQSDSVAKRDSVPVPYPVKEYVKVKYTPGFVKFLAWTGGILLLVVLGWVGFKYLFPLIKKYS